MKISALILAAALFTPNAREVAIAVFDAALIHQVDPWLLIALGKHESDYDPSAVSSVGAIGYWQLMPRWWGAHPLRMYRARPSECTWFHAHYAAAAVRHFRRLCPGQARTVRAYRTGRPAGKCLEPRSIDFAVVRTRNRLARRFGGGP